MKVVRGEQWILSIFFSGDYMTELVYLTGNLHEKITKDEEEDTY